MDRYPIKGTLPAKEEKIVFDGTFRGKYRGFAVFLICCAILIAAFAVSAVWKQGGDGGFGKLGAFWQNEDETTAAGEQDTTAETPPSNEPPSPPAPIPEGATPVVEKDLSYPSLGQSYLHNETPYKPCVEDLLKQEITFGASSGEPLVLILHTHTSERYLPDGTTYVEGAIGDVAYSRDATENVLAVGEVLCRTLNEKGIPAIHCTEMHDDPTLSGSYARAEKTVKSYLEQYPTIVLVIDLHRDAVMTADGELVRTMAGDGERAQVMAVVGTDANGTPHPRWKENLALALQLRERMNGSVTGACRPVSLRNASFYQELAQYSLLLEIGTVANSPEEAKLAARTVGEQLAVLIQSAVR